MTPPNFDLSLWFSKEVQPHRPALRAWLLAHFPSLYDIDDLVQESCARVLRVKETASIGSVRAFLFTTARNLALDAVRRQRVVGFVPITDDVDWPSLEEDTDVVAIVNKRQELELLTLAIQSLPTRARRIMTLRTAYGFTPPQIAESLGISLSTVEKEMAKSIRACKSFFSAHDCR